MIHPIDAADWTYVLNIAAAYVDERRLLEQGDREAATLASTRYRETVARVGSVFGDREMGLRATADRWAGDYLRDATSVPRLERFLTERDAPVEETKKPTRRKK